MMTAGARDPRAGADLALAQRCAAGNRAAQKQLFSDYKALVHATLYRILGTNTEMEDLVQDSFLEVFRSLPRFRGEAKLSTWVSRITTRVAFAHLSRRKPAAAPLDLVPEQPVDGPDSSDIAESREAARRLYAALDKIDPVRRVAFALHVIDGRPLKDVAQAMESTVVATKSRVWRARKELDKRAKRDPILAQYLAEQESGS